MTPSFEAALAAGRVGDRLWLYATYHCNLACTYCLTESWPGIANRRALARVAMVDRAAEARELGFGCLGVTGGEVFMLPDVAETLAELAAILPTIALTNATLFTDRMLERLEPLVGADVAFQVSLDAADPSANDAGRGTGNHRAVVEAIPRLVARGHRVRVATTVASQTPEQRDRLCALHRSLGVPDEDHVVRGIVRRGRAAARSAGVELGPSDVLPELTITADGAFLHPFAPTVRSGRTDLDLLVSRITAPLELPLAAFLELAAGLPAGGDVVRNVR